MMNHYLKMGFMLSLPGFLSFTKLRDYKRLNKYLLEVHKANDFAEITKELSECINDIFNHDFFALAVNIAGKMMVWVEPSVFRDTIISVIESDFSFEGEPEVYPVNISRTGLLLEKKVRDNLFGKAFSGKNFEAKLYILPGRRFLGRYHADIISNIVIGLESALSKQICIKELEDAASTDPLTKCYNRREFEKQLNQQYSISKRKNKSFSLVMFDIDHFKKINDTYGHQAGDFILTEMASRIRSVIRVEDSFFRYGGEEFVLTLPETDSCKACVLAHRLKELVSNAPFIYGKKSIPVTASFGVSSYDKDGSSPEEVLKKADLMLYKAKEAGRNRVMSTIIRLCKKNSPQFECS